MVKPFDMNAELEKLPNDRPMPSHEDEPASPELKRHRLVVVSAALVVVPSSVILLACLWYLVALIAFPPQDAPPSVFIGVVLFPAPILVILLAEYHALVKRSAAASLVIGALFLIPLLPSLVSLGRGALGLGGFLQPDPALADWRSVAAVGAMTSYAAMIGVGHLRWWRALVRQSHS